MPKLPAIMDMKATSIDILNAIRNGASATYQGRIPEATQENIRDIGNAMMMYESNQNEFLSALVNRIGRVIITSKSYSNPLKPFKKGMLEYGETVEEVFVAISKAHPFDPQKSESTVFKREIPDVQAVFHRMNLQNFYKATISNDMLRQAFLSAQGVTDLIARIVDQMYTGSEFDEFITMKELIAQAANDGKMYPIAIPAISAENAKAIVTTIKSVSNKLTFMNSVYNYMGVLTHTARENQIILLDSDFDATIDVEVLASAFNLSKVEFMGQRVLLDNFGSLTGVVAAIVDRDWFMVFDNYLNFTENYNGEGLYWNYFYHVWKTFSTSPFSNAILFTTGTTAVTGVTITPTTATVPKGTQIQLTPAVSGTGYIDKSVSWETTGTASSITPTGLLTVTDGETETTLTVTATSNYDNTKKATATITVG